MPNALLSLNCPQCAAPLPRAARWRTVQCPYCGCTVQRARESVRRADFRAARARAQAVALAQPHDVVERGALRYRVLGLLGRGTHSEVLWAERTGALPERVTIKLAPTPEGTQALTRERQVLDGLQATEGPGAAYFTRRLPQPVTCGPATWQGRPMHALVLRHPAGFWGSLAAVVRAQPGGIDPRHAVWIWRRMLEVLTFVHGQGFAHGDLSPDHALVHAPHHGVLLIGWAAGTPHADAAQQARDLRQSAWTVRALLSGTAHADRAPGTGAATPAPLADLLRRCSEDAREAGRLGAAGLEAALTDAARAAFGAPRFLPFDLQGGAGQGSGG